MIYIQLRSNNTQPIITVVTGFGKGLNLKDIKYEITRTFNCGIQVINEDINSLIISGDFRSEIRNYLVQKKINRDEDIVEKMVVRSQIKYRDMIRNIFNK